MRGRWEIVTQPHSRTEYPDLKAENDEGPAGAGPSFATRRGLEEPESVLSPARTSGLEQARELAHEPLDLNALRGDLEELLARQERPRVVQAEREQPLRGQDRPAADVECFLSDLAHELARRHRRPPVGMTRAHRVEPLSDKLHETDAVQTGLTLGRLEERCLERLVTGAHEAAHRRVIEPCFPGGPTTQR